MSNFEVLQDGGLPVKMWTKGVPVEDSARGQLLNLSRMPFIHKHVAAMPDVHWGMGATVGSVIATKGAIIPAAVGVDIGCGMMASKTSLSASDLPDSLKGIRSAIEAAVPVGRAAKGPDPGAWKADDVPTEIDAAWATLVEGFNGLVAKHQKLQRTNNRVHLGTLGTGNHFIEICLDEAGAVWVMLHSGSRGVGNAIGSYFIELAKQDMRKWFVNLPDMDLSYFPQGTEHFSDYFDAVHWAQEFARTNRECMMRNVLRALRSEISKPFEDAVMAVNCHHNYVSWENHFGDNVMVTRKGAVRARTGDLGIIPGSMGVRSYIVRGKGNADSFTSCSHGAGRTMSRGEARRSLTIEDHIKATEGVECRKDIDVIDESPAAYKDIDAVMAAQADLVDVVHILKQVVCVKG